MIMIMIMMHKPEEDRHFVLKNGLHKKIANNPRRAIYITRAAGGPGPGGCQWGGYFDPLTHPKILYV